ncbi:MAG: DUF4261 domain-containing protein [Deltaproteobacteria bacterium]|jgi:hypothetical protein|nr:DUF4261 domain-containing protein [Deltaproteobacteria bacterium]
MLTFFPPRLVSLFAGDGRGRGGSVAARMVCLAAVLVALVGGGLARGKAPIEDLPVGVALLAEPRLRDPDAFRADLQSRLGAAVTLGAITATPDSINLETSVGRILVEMSNQPLGQSDFGYLCATAWYWPEACPSTANHKAHAIVVFVTPIQDRVGVRLVVSHALAALMDENVVAGSAGGALHSRAEFKKETETMSRTAPPVLLWVVLRVSKHKRKGVTVSTDGLSPFGLRELEARDVRVDPLSVTTTVAAVAHLLIEKGPIFADGDTLGDDRVRVEQGVSSFDPTVQVYHLRWPR